MGNMHSRLYFADLAITYMTKMRRLWQKSAQCLYGFPRSIRMLSIYMTRFAD